MGRVERSGKHAAPRHAAHPTAQPREPVRIDASRLDPVARPAHGGPGAGPSVLLLALGITAAVVAWGYLVYLAIDFGTAARDGGDFPDRFPCQPRPPRRTVTTTSSSYTVVVFHM
jgi:hypothetical protein